MARNRIRIRIPFFVFLCFTFAGIAFGFILNNLAAGILIGLGTGMVMMVILRFIRGRKNAAPEKQKEHRVP